MLISIFFNALLQDICIIYDQNKQIKSIHTTTAACITYFHSQLKFQAYPAANAFEQNLLNESTTLIHVTRHTVKHGLLVILVRTLTAQQITADLKVFPDAFLAGLTLRCFPLEPLI